jgi:hypothetical protein
MLGDNSENEDNKIYDIYIGKMLNEFLKDFPYKSIRILKPNSYITEEYHKERINIKIDTENKITSIYKG